MKHAKKRPVERPCSSRWRRDRQYKMHTRWRRARSLCLPGEQGRKRTHSHCTRSVLREQEESALRRRIRYSRQPRRRQDKLERIRQRVGSLSDGNRSILRKGLSICAGRCLYLRRWISPRNSGKRFGARFPSPSGRVQRHAAGDRGGIHATCSMGSCGCCAPARRGPTCRAGIRRIRRAMTASRSGSARASWTASSPLSRETFTSAASWT